MPIMRFIMLLFLLAAPGFLRSQSLEFLGLKGVSFGMNSKDLSGKTVILDSTSSYKDTATYLRNTRCQLFFRKNENLALKGFNASRVEYEFCDKSLTYVFVYVKGQSEIDKAIAELKKTFPKLGCKGNAECSQMDSAAKGMRIIVNIDRKTQQMNFVLIAKKQAGH